MQKDLYIKEKSQRKAVVKNDDLVFDGKSLVIPSYWVSSIFHFVKDVNENSIDEADREDFKQFKDFLLDVEEFTNKGN
jgi:hypothetical protein